VISASCVLELLPRPFLSSFQFLLFFLFFSSATLSFVFSRHCGRVAAFSVLELKFLYLEIFFWRSIFDAAALGGESFTWLFWEILPPLGTPFLKGFLPARHVFLPFLTVEIILRIKSLIFFTTTYRLVLRRVPLDFLIYFRLAMASNGMSLPLGNGLSKTPQLNRADEVDDVSPNTSQQPSNLMLTFTSCSTQFNL